MAQVLRKAEAEGYRRAGEGAVLDEPAEQALALLLTRFGEVVDEVADTLQPHRLCAYLYDLAGALSVFYEQCPVLKSDGEVRDSRLALCLATKRCWPPVSTCSASRPSTGCEPGPPRASRGYVSRVGVRLPVGGEPGGADDAGGVEQLGRDQLGVQLELGQELLGRPC